MAEIFSPLAIAYGDVLLGLIVQTGQLHFAQSRKQRKMRSRVLFLGVLRRLGEREDRVMRH